MEQWEITLSLTFMLSMASAFPFLLFSIPPLTLHLPSLWPNSTTVSPTDHEAKVSLSVLSILAAQVSLECQ